MNQQSRAGTRPEARKHQNTATACMGGPISGSKEGERRRILCRGHVVSSASLGEQPDLSAGLGNGGTCTL